VSEPFQTVFMTSLVPTAVAREDDGTILLANPAWLELLGWEEEDVVGKSAENLGFWARPERRAEIVAALGAGGGLRDLEEEIRTRSGHTLTVLISISAIELEGARCLVGAFHDITERRRVDSVLRMSEEYFRQVTETVQQGFLLLDVDRAVTLYASPAVARIFGIDEAAVYRTPLAIDARIHPDDRETVVAKRDMMTGPDDFEFRIVRPDGETRWVRTRAQPVKVDRGEGERLAAVIDDITDERELREALRVSEEYFRQFVGSVTDYAIIMLDVAGCVTGWNPGAERIKGYRADEIIGRHFSIFYPPALIEAGQPQRELAVALAAGRYQEEGERVRKDGTRFWADVSLMPIRDDAGELRGFAKVTRDITAHKRAEAAVRSAREQAEQANAAKSEFLSRMSHELRTPLHAILGFGELLTRTDLPKEEREQLSQLIKSGHHLLDLINEVLDISRIDRGELTLSLEAVHVGELIEETLGMVLPLATAASVAVVWPPGKDLGIHVLADRQRLKQVLLNLCSNAIKYNRPGGTMTLSCAPDGAPRVRITVADTGIGIAPDKLPRVFEPFDRLGAETTEVEGTGLGLALSKRLMEAMRGSISVESAVGEGTTVRLELPLVPAPAAPRPGHSESPVSGARERGQARTVLYVEDNPSNIKLVEAILAARPEVKLIVATQGSLALELAREHQPALILLDLNLPDISGEEVLRRIRGDARTAKIPVVITSADATYGHVERLGRAGADDYLTKPFGLERFLEVIDGSPAADASEGAGAGEGEGAGEGAGEGEGEGEGEPVAGLLEPSATQALHELAGKPGVGAAAIRELVDTFLVDARERCAGIETALGAGDLAEVKRQAHALGGASGWAGATQVLKLCRALEAAAEDSDAGSARSAAADLGHALPQASAALEAEFGEA